MASAAKPSSFSSSLVLGFVEPVDDVGFGGVAGDELGDEFAHGGDVVDFLEGFELLQQRQVLRHGQELFVGLHDARAEGVGITHKLSPPLAMAPV